jgi:hypothetical protein
MNTYMTGSTIKGALVLRDIVHLSAQLQIPTKQLIYLGYSGDKFYRSFEIPKSNGKTRTIQAPTGILKSVQRSITNVVLNPLQRYLPGYICGFREGGTIQEGARIHVGAEQLIKYDLQNFFDTISMGMVYKMFKHAGLPNDVSWFLSRICTRMVAGKEAVDRKVVGRSHSYQSAIYRQQPVEQRPRHWKRLTPKPRVTGDPWDPPDKNPHYLRSQSRRFTPQGTPTSPAVSNLVSRIMHARLNGLAESMGLKYSAFADDLTFSVPSGSRPLGKKALKRLDETIRKIIDEEHLKLNDKGGVYSSSQRLVVTGVVVNEKTNVTKDYYRNLRAAMHQYMNGKSTQTIDQIRGRFEFLRNCNPERAASLRAAYPIF